MNLQALEPETIRFGGLLFGFVFTAATVAIVKPPRGLLIPAAVASAAYTLLDLVLEYFAHVHNIWICHGEPQFLFVPIVMSAQFLLQGPGLCFTLVPAARRLEGKKFFLFAVLYTIALSTILWLLEFVWSGAGLTDYTHPSTSALVFLGWLSLLATLFGVFLALARKKIVRGA